MLKLKSSLKTLLVWLLALAVLVETALILTQFETWRLGKQVQKQAVEKFLKR